MTLQLWDATMIETDVDRRGINPKTDMKLYLSRTVPVIKRTSPGHGQLPIRSSLMYMPDMPADSMRIPYCVNVQGLGTAFQKKGLSGDRYKNV